MAKVLDDLLGVSSYDEANNTVTNTSNKNALIENSASYLPADLTKNESDESQFKEDFDTARENIIDAVQLSSEMYSLIAKVAKETEKNRDFEVANQYLKTRLDAAKHLLDIHAVKEKRKILEERETNGKGDVNINNAIITTSAKNLKNLLRAARDESANTD